MKKNELITIEITGMTSEGAGVGKYEGMAVLVAQTAVGDTIEARIIKIAKNYAVGKLSKVLFPSADRCEVDCPIFSLCGGCEFRHISYEAELRYKEQRVKDAISRIGGLSPTLVRPILGAENPLRYRNKAQIPVGKNREGKPVMGFYANHSHRIVPMEDCLLQPVAFTEIQKIFFDWVRSGSNSIYDEETGKGCLRHLYLRCGEDSGEIMVCIVAASEPKDLMALVETLREVPGVVSVLINLNPKKTNVILGETTRTLFGKGEISDLLLGLTLSVKPLSFYQVNHRQTETLYRKALEYADPKPEEILLDLYCGTGTIGLTMASKVKELYGVEIIEDAVKDAAANAGRNKIGNAKFLCSDAAKAAEYFLKRGIRPDIITLDPPRKGCSAELIETVADMAPKKIVYVSCDPATLARDLKLFAQAGYPLSELTPVDLFPRTANVETVCCLYRKKDDDISVPYEQMLG